MAWIKAITAGKATSKGLDGADFWLKKYGRLPDYYIDTYTAKKAGWTQYSGNLHMVAPNKMISKVYGNYDGKLPHVLGRLWTEADINYTHGYRNGERIIFSNDGLVFVTYDHYKTFIEIV